MERERIEEWGREVLALAARNVADGHGGPFAALVFRGEEVISRAVNRVFTINDPTAHAEVMAIREACRILGDFSLAGCSIISSCEPCPMCLSAIYWARLDKVYYVAGKEDAARAGFDDALIYRELALQPENRQLPSSRLDLPDAFKPFDDWLNKPDKVDY